MARQFDRPSTGNMVTPAQIVRYFDKFLTALESVLAGQQDQLDAITALQTQQATQLADIETLQSQMLDRIAEIEAAQTTADAVTRDNSISASWVSGLTLSASDAGTDASITIPDHTRFYDDTTSLAITGATLTGLAYSTQYHVYYDDSTRADTTPAFQVSTDASVAAPNRASGRHYVGSITTAAPGGGSTSGGGSEPPGWRGTGTL